MNRVLSALLFTMVLSGCSTVGNVFKKTGQILMDPSIQVGSAEEQPTQVALSLFAGHDVNPNEDSTPVLNFETASETSSLTEIAGVDGGSEGPFAIRLNSRSKVGLIESLRTLLGHLEEDGEKPPPLPVQPIRLRAGYPAGKPPAARQDLAVVPSHWLLREVLDFSKDDRDAAPPLPLAAANVSAQPDGLAPGQYQRGVSLQDDIIPDAPSSRIATPIAFKIVQLKDDSLLLNASADQLQQDMKKALGSTYLSADDYVLVPGQFKFIHFRPIHEEANFVAVIADFRDPSTAVWKDVFRLEPHGRRYALLIALLGTHVSITDESYRPVRSSPPSKKP